MKKLILLLFGVFFWVYSNSQQLAAFNDYKNHFWAFEAGQFQKLEYLEIQDFQVGGLLIAYLDNRGDLKIYRNGEVETLLSGNPMKYKTSDYLLGYSLYEQLYVYDNGDTKLLSSDCDGYIVQDSLISWHNRIKQTIQVYYKGIRYTIEDGLIYYPVRDFKSGDNILVYIQRSTEELKAFYHGQIFILEEMVEDPVFEVGRDIVAYYDQSDPSFRAFYKGEDIVLEDFAPKSFQVGDEMVAYVDNLGRLKYFDGSETVTLSNYEPQFYEVTDRVVVFEEQGFFKTFCNGDVYVIERYIPSTYQLDVNTIAYLDENQFVKAFQNCEHITIGYEKVKKIHLIRDLIFYVEGINRPKVYFLGQVFEQ